MRTTRFWKQAKENAKTYLKVLCYILLSVKVRHHLHISTQSQNQNFHRNTYGYCRLKTIFQNIPVAARMFSCFVRFLFCFCICIFNIIVHTDILQYLLYILHQCNCVNSNLIIAYSPFDFYKYLSFF